MAKQNNTGKYVYYFGGGKADGNESMKNLLGGKGANLAEMAGHPKLRLPVPPGFTVTTEVCTYYYNNKKTYPKILKTQVEEAVAKTEKLTGKKFGDPKNPLLVSVRSGARRSMPGMMETVLNVGLNENTLKGIIARSADERFAYDAYRRLIMMYADVVMEKGGAVEVKNGKGIRKILDEKLEHIKQKKGYRSDTDLTVAELKELVKDYKKTVRKVLGKDFPDDPWQQLWGGMSAVFSSWNGKRAVEYRRIEKIPDEWGTAVNIQAMVFGNMGNDSCTGVAFTRNPGTGENKFMVNTLSMHKAKMWLQAPGHRHPLMNIPRMLKANILPRLRKSYPGFTKNYTVTRKGLNCIIKTCRILCLRSKRENYICCSAVLANGMV